ncbi:hypothetical protein [Mesorhizobium sp. LNJC391B00]|uniref:hypothetical protein n=1 Tax=Mesorhizobium sp. LNJC391B00 TaxID=1287273 RepID=UPI0003CE60ED|nr:hypothetical protein [Mesorhizobium sp. LNJC391B00]ESY31632.1 hypothetical protein X749_08735 [Mesorhizobium sp. LNJC391B00]
MKSHFSQLAIKWLEVVVRRASATTNYRGVWGVVVVAKSWIANANPERKNTDGWYR